MGLYGVDAPVPHYITEVTARDDEQSEAFKAFLNIFSHRFYALFYRAWKKYNPAIFLEYDDISYRQYLSSIAGCAAEPVGGEELAYAGVLGSRSKNADGLKGIIREYLEIEHVEIKQFIPRWVSLDAVPALGAHKNQLILGDNTVLGQRVLDMGGKIQLNIGPIDMQTVLQLLPQRKKGTQLGRHILRYLSPAINYDILFIVKADKNWRIQLGVTEANLGWTTVLGEFKEKYYSIKIPGQLYKERPRPKTARSHVVARSTTEAEVA